MILKFIASLAVAQAAYCKGKPHDDAKPNLIPIYTDEPTFVRKYQDEKGNEAQLWSTGEGDDTMSIVHIWADSHYDRGFIQGKLMEEDMPEFYGKVW